MKQLKDGLQQLGIAFTSEQQQQCMDFLALLQKWNGAYNLTAIKDLEDMVVLHLLDSLAVGPHLQGERILDVGTGAGLPGIPLAILFPEKTFYLLDSNQKKVTFTQQVKLTLGIDNIYPVKARIEDYQEATPFDTVISRAFSSLTDFFSLCQPVVSKDGCFIAMKGSKPDKELELLDGRVRDRQCVKLDVPFMDANRCLVIFKQ